MFSRHLRAALCGAIATLTSVGPTLSHEIVGNRFFPATLTIDDPGVNDELAFPTVAISKTGDDPSFKQLDVSAEFAKRITDDFAIAAGADVVAALRARRSDHEWRKRFPEFGDVIQISSFQKPRA